MSCHNYCAQRCSAGTRKGPAGHLTYMMVLRVDSESVLRALYENPQTRVYLGEDLGGAPCRCMPDTAKTYVTR